MSGKPMTQLQLTKNCIRCKQKKTLSEFHKHSGMADGRLNKCAVCVKECVAEWRLKNPGCRAKEYAKQDRAKVIALEVASGVRLPYGSGRDKRKTRIRSLKYSHKRRRQTEQLMSEWDMFVAEEAFRLAAQRTGLSNIKWTVDHIVPLNHSFASGLHNGFNLQVVPASWNYKKGNRNMNSFWPIKPLEGTDGR